MTNEYYVLLKRIVKKSTFFLQAICTLKHLEILIPKTLGQNKLTNIFSCSCFGCLTRYQPILFDQYKKLYMRGWKEFLNFIDVVFHLNCSVYSGTVAGAREAFFNGIPSISLSYEWYVY